MYKNVKRIMFLLIVIATGVATKPSLAQLQPANASFETPVLAAPGRMTVPQGANWTFTGVAGIERPTSSLTGFAGNQTAFLSGSLGAKRGEIAQVINFPAPGLYAIRFAAARIGAENALAVSVAGAVVEPSLKIRGTGSGEWGTVFDQWWTQPFNVAAAGEAQLKFSLTSDASDIGVGDRILIDQVVVLSVPFALPNASFESTIPGSNAEPAGWSSSYANVVSSTEASAGGASGNNVLRLGYYNYSGSMLTIAAVWVPAGTYVLSFRAAKRSAAGSSGCPASLAYRPFGQNTAFQAATTIPAPDSADFLPYTSRTFTIGTAGNYQFYLYQPCGGVSVGDLYDSLLVQRAGAELANASFEAPDLGMPEDGLPRQQAPSGASWNFTGQAGIGGNVSTANTSNAYRPRTFAGKQFGFGVGGGAGLGQAVSLQPGTYALVYKTATGNHRVTVNGTAQRDVMRSAERRIQTPTANGYSIVEYGFSEILSAPFSVDAVTPVTLGFTADVATGSFGYGFDGFTIDEPVLIQLTSNLPPSVAITEPTKAPGKNYAVVQGGGPVNVNVVATATDSDGLKANSLHITNNGSQIGSAASTSPFTAQLSGLAIGSYTLRAYATDLLGLQGVSPDLLLKVNNPPQGGFMLAPSGDVLAPGGAPVTVTVTPSPTDTDGTVAQTQVLVDNQVRPDCTRNASPWGCTFSLAPRGAAYNITVRATDDDNGVTTYPAGSVSINAPPVVSITTPPNAVTIGYGTGYAITATAKDVDNGVASIQIRDGGTNLGAACTFTAVANLTRTCTVSLPTTATLGAHSITAVATDAAGKPVSTTSVPVVVTVLNASATALTADVTSLTTNQGFTLTATISPSTATGTVSFSDGATMLCSSVALTGTTTKTATCAVSPASVATGMHTYLATYSGDATTAPSNASLTLKTVSMIAAGYAPNPVLAGQALTLTATLSPSAATGTVTFSEGATTICAAVALNGPGNKTATCSVPSERVTLGNHSYSLAYSGDSSYLASNATLTVTAKTASMTSLTASVGTITPGVPFTLTAEVNPSSATGTVSFVEGITTHCANVPLGTTIPKRATCTVSAANATAGGHVYVAAYGGDGSTAASSATIALKTSTVTTVVSSPNPSSFGAQIAIAATVDQSLATGAVNFFDVTVPATPIALCQGQPLSGAAPKIAVCNLSTALGTPAASLTVGTHVYQAVYAGDAKFAPSSGNSLTHTVSAAPLSCSLTASPAAPLVGAAATITANCKANGVNVAGVAISWTGACTSSTSSTDATGNATCTYTAGANASTFSIAASKANYTASNPAATLTVTPAVNTPPKVVSMMLSGGGAVLIGQQATLQVIGSDTDGSVSSISITGQMVGGAALTPTSCTNTNTCSLQWTPNVAGLYAFTANVKDNQGATVTATQTVAVSETVGVSPLPRPDTVNIGTTAGQFAVSESGAATYSIPIAVAPGVNGVQPNLALTYNSQGGDGNLGVGWNLAGISSITRCPKIIATDGVREAINYDNVTDPVSGNDAFCLDGQRLVPVSGGLTQVSCSAIAGVTPNGQCRAWEFRAELDNYSRIIGIGDNVDPALPGSGSGPTRFRIYTKSGQILEYGSRWWGIGAPRPDPQTSLIPNPSFEDTHLEDSCWITGSVNPFYYDWAGNWVSNPCYGNSSVPQNWGGYGTSSALGYFKTSSTGASSNGWTFGVSAGLGNSGVQRNTSAMSISGPYTSDGSQSVFLQQRGWASTTAYLEAGNYRLGVKLAGRPDGAAWGGNQDIAVKVDGVTQAVLSTMSGQAFTSYTVDFTIGGSGLAPHEIRFEGQRTDDQTALLDAITLVPLNEDIFSLKVFPLDRVEDRTGNYMHIDYGGTHENQVLVYPDGSVRSVTGTVVSSYGNATLPDKLPATAVQAVLIAQGARPALEMYPRRLTYGMRTAVPGSGNNQASVGGVEVARVILNYECIDGSTPDTNGSCQSRPGVIKGYDTGAGQMLRSKRLASIFALVGGSDDTSRATDRDNFHWNEMTNGVYADGAQCLTGQQTSCGTLLRKYTLGYEVSPTTQRVRLARVTECSGDGLCLPASTFGWQDSALSFSATGTGSQSNKVGADWNALLRMGRVGDVVGDGRSRIVKRESSGSQLKVCSHNGASFDCVVRAVSGAAVPDDTGRDTWYLGDYNGDGIADLIIISGTSAWACPSVSSTGSAIADQFGGCSQLPNPYPAGSLPRLQNRLFAKTADFDGDGRIDILFYRGDYTFELCRWDTIGGWGCVVPVKFTGLYVDISNGDNLRDNALIADFNGDGRADIAIRVSSGCAQSLQTIGTPTGTMCSGQYATDNDPYWVVCFATGSPTVAAGQAGAMQFACATHSGGGVGAPVKAVAGKINKLAVYDFNGDGLADLASPNFAGSAVNGWKVCMATGDGEFARDPNGGGECPIWYGPTFNVNVAVAGDFNGDGRTDFAGWISGTQWQVCLSTGQGFNCSYQVGPPQPAICDNNCSEVIAGDFNGDGKSDLIVNAYGTNGTLYYAFTNAVMPDLLGTVTTGFGAQTRVSYEPLSKPNGVYSKNLSLGAGDPDPGVLADNEIVIQSPMYVVSRTLASTGDGSRWYRTNYAYNNLRADKWGRGLVGFYRRSITDNQVADIDGNDVGAQQPHTTGIISSLTWPNVRRPLKVVKVVSGKKISSSTMQYGSRSSATGVVRTNGAGGQYARWEAFQVKSTQNPDRTDTDLDGTSKAPRVTTFTGVDSSTGAVNLSAFYDSFGNPLQVVTRTEHPTTTEVWTQTVSNTYYSNGADTTRWLLGKVQSATTTTSVSGYTTNGETSVTRKSAFTYHGYGGSCPGAVYGQLCTETVEPNAATGTAAPFSDRSLWQQSAYEYDLFGNRTTTTVSFYDDATGSTGVQARQSVTSYLYGKYPTTVTRRFVAGSSNSRDLTETRSYEDSRCRLATKVTDANGNYATTEYDGFCRKVRESAWTNDGKLAKQSSFTLTTTGINSGNGEKYALETRSADISNTDQRTSIQFYDNLQRAVRAQARAFDGSFSQSSTVFDALGRQGSVSKPVSSGAGSSSATTYYQFDALNRVVLETLPDGNTVSTTYAGLSTTVTRSNSNGTTGGSANARVTQKINNARGSVASVIANAGASLTTTASYVYDALGNLTQVSTPGANSTTLSKSMGYDLRGRQISLSDPDAGSYSYGYNGVGEQVRQSDARGFITLTGYDGFGRKSSRREGDAMLGQPTSLSAGGVLTVWTYDTCGNGSTARAAGLLCAVGYGGTNTAANATSKALAYDQYARPISTTTALGGLSFQSQLAYDAAGRPKYAIYPQASPLVPPLAIETVYNDKGFASQTKNAVTGFVYQGISTRNSDGQLNGATLAGGLLTQANSYGSDGLGRIASIGITQTAGGAGVLAQGFGFESIGNLKSRTLSGGGRNESESFLYDALDRLTQNSGSGLTNSPADTGSYVIDAAGNLSNKAGLPLGYQSNSNRLCNIGASSCTSVNVSYDASGNITSYTRPTAAQSNNTPGADGATLTLSGYTAFNLPTSIGKSGGSTPNASASFHYDAGYQRIRQLKWNAAGTQVDDILYVVPGGFEVHRDQNGNVTQAIATVTGAEGAIASVTTYFDPSSGQAIIGTQNGVSQGGNTAAISGVNTVTRILLKDHLSSMVAEVVILGTPGAPTLGTVTVHGFGPWGNARNAGSPLNVDQRGFTGHEHLAELGIIHMNGRLYDPVLGRFLQADPIIQAPHNAQSHNRYSYVLNNPLSFTDPSGFSWWTTWRRPIFAIATAWFLGPGSFSFFGAGGVFGSGGLGLLSGTTASFASTVAAGFAAGGIQGGNIQSALQGAFSAALFIGVGQFIPGDAGSFGKVVAHAAAGCASASVAGGSCRAGAISNGFAEFAGPQLGNWGDAGNFIKHVAIAAVGAKLAGGKAENAALTAAFGYLFNHGMAAATAAARATVAATTTTCTPCGGKQGTPLDYETGVPPQVAVGPRLPDIGGFIMDVSRLAAMFTPIAIADRLAGIIFSKPPSDAYDPNGSKAPGKPGEAEGFSDPRTGERWVKNPNGRGNGWLDADGKVWVPSGQGGEAHGGPHWDVQNPRKPDDYENIYPGGKRR